MSEVLDMSRVSSRREEPSRLPVPAPDITPTQILALAVQQGADLQKLEKLMELQERWEANQARKAFDAAISAAKAEIKPILKTSEVDFTSSKGRTHYSYEDFAQIALQVDPILAKHGLSYRHRSKQKGKELTIICRVAHEAGYFEETELSADNDESGNKNTIQSIGSTATYLQRYTLKIALGLAAAKDTDGRFSDPGPKITENQAADLKSLITENGGNLGKLLAYFKVRSLDEILAKNFDWAVAEVKRFAADRAASRSKT